MLVAVGLNHKGATVADRERLALGGGDPSSALAAYTALDGVDEVVLLSTCYRVEIFAASSCPSAAVLSLRQALTQRARRDVPLFELCGEEAFRHLVRVAASLESAVLGEPQVLGQVKAALARAAEAGTAGKELTAVMGRAFQAAKRVRTETAIGRSGQSWGAAAAVLAQKVLGPVRGLRTAIVGAGEMARLSAQHLREQGAEVVVLNRTLENAIELAREVGGTARPLDRLEDELARADVVVSAAPAAPPALGPDAVARLLRARRRRIVLVDLAVPRAVPPETGRVPDVFLFDVDDLQRVLEGTRAERAAAVADADRIVQDEVQKFVRADAERRAAPLIQEMRSRAASIAREEVERTVRRLGKDPELHRRLDALAGAIVSKILHVPSARLREAVCDASGGEAIVKAAVEMFGLCGAAHPGEDRARG